MLDRGRAGHPDAHTHRYTGCHGVGPDAAAVGASFAEGARETMRYIGDLVSEGVSILIFPEGQISHRGDVLQFQPGVGMLASRLDVPVVPVRLKGVDQVLHPTWRMARPGRVTVTFGTPLRLEGQDYATLAQQVEGRCERAQFVSKSPATRNHIDARPAGPRQQIESMRGHGRRRTWHDRCY